MHDDNGDSKTRLLAFGSLKGGVGKTTLSLLAVEALVQRRAQQRSTTTPSSNGVVLIDADIVGTEASDVVGIEYEEHEQSLAQIIGRVPDEKSVYNHLEREINSLVQRGRDRYVIRSFPRAELESRRRVWREVLEHSGLYVQRRILDLVRVCRAAKLDVVVDLPAFDVGFARQVRLGLAHDKPSVFFVTDCDVRSLRAVLVHFKFDNSENGDDLRFVVNRIPAGGDTAIKDMLSDYGILDGVLVHEQQAVLDATRAEQAGGNGGKATTDPLGPPTAEAPIHHALREYFASATSQILASPRSAPVSHTHERSRYQR